MFMISRLGYILKVGVGMFLKEMGFFIMIYFGKERRVCGDDFLICLLVGVGFIFYGSFIEVV